MHKHTYGYICLLILAAGRILGAVAHAAWSPQLQLAKCCWQCEREKEKNNNAIITRGMQIEQLYIAIAECSNHAALCLTVCLVATTRSNNYT